jgi:hypothetical protein
MVITERDVSKEMCSKLLLNLTVPDIVNNIRILQKCQKLFPFSLRKEVAFLARLLGNITEIFISDRQHRENY